MSEALLIRRGGSGKLYAVIAVTYPAGSVCTCTNGTKTLKAKDAGGRALFNVPSAGTWTVSCTDGTDTASKAVSIAAEGQIENVALSYALWLYNMGDQCTDITGGWMQTGGAAVTFGANAMSVYTNNYNGSTNAATKNKINLAGVKTLYFLLTSITSYPTGYPRIGVSSTNNPKPNETGTYVASKTLSAMGSYTTVALDVSKVSGSYYIVIGGIYGDAGKGTITVQKVWGTYL